MVSDSTLTTSSQETHNNLRRVANQSNTSTEAGSATATTMSNKEECSLPEKEIKQEKMFLLSVDGFHLTQQAAEVLSGNTSINNHDDDAVVRRKLLRRRHVRKLQKVRAATTIIEAPAASTNNNNNHATEVTTDRPSANAIFASQYFSFVDCFQKPPKRRAVAETPQANSSSSSSSASSWSSSSTSSSSSSPTVEHHHRRLEVQYDPGCSSPTKSPIRPRILPMWPDTPVPDETIHLKPPMSPIQITGFVATTNMGDFEGNNKHRHTTTTSSSSYNNYFSPISLKRKFHSTLL